MTAWWEQLLVEEFTALLWLSLVAAIVVLLAMVGQHVFGRRISARWMCVFWSLVLLRFVLFLAPESSISLMNLGAYLDSAPKHEIVSEPRPFQGATIEYAEARGIDPAPFAPIVASSEPPVSGFSGWGWMLIAKSVWLFGITLLAIRFFYHWLRVSRLRIRARKPDAKLGALFERLKTDLGVSKAELLVTDQLVSPGMVGWFQPVVYLPAWSVDELSLNQCEYVLAHELVHVKRQDYFVQLAACWIAMVHWFNPFVYLACCRINYFREIACDHEVLDFYLHDRAAKTEYGNTILRIAEHNLVRQTNTPMLIGNFLGNDKELVKQRIAMIVHNQPSSQFRIVLFAIFVFGFLTTSFTVAQSQEKPVPEQPAVEALGERELNSEPENKSALPRAKFEPGRSFGVEAGRGFTLDFGFNVESLMVSDPNVINVVPSSSNTFLVEGKGIGVSVITVDDPNGNEQSFAVYIQPEGVPFLSKIPYIGRLFKNVKATRISTEEVESKEVGRLTAEALKLKFLDKGNVESEEVVPVWAGSARSLEFDFKIPEVMVEDPSLVNVMPVSPVRLLVDGLKPGETKVHVYNQDRTMKTLRLVVTPNPVKLALRLNEALPESDIKVDVQDAKVILKGHGSAQERLTAEKIVRDFGSVKVDNRIIVSQSSRQTVSAIEVCLINRNRVKELKTELPDGELSRFLNGKEQPKAKSFKVQGEDINRLLDQLAEVGCLKFESSPRLICQLGESAQMTLGNAEFLVGSPIPIKHEIKVSPRPFEDSAKIQLELSVQCTRYTGVEVTRRLRTGVALGENEQLALLLNLDSTDGRETEWTDALYLIRTSKLVDLKGANRFGK